MKKEHKNLNPDNLIKTEAYSNFTDKEKEEILKGLQVGLDVSIYAKKDFNWKQMEQIRLGLEDNLDVSIYAKPEISDEQMGQIREKLQKESTL